MFKLERFRNLQLIVSIKAESQAVTLIVLCPMGSPPLCLDMECCVLVVPSLTIRGTRPLMVSQCDVFISQVRTTINYLFWRAEISRITRTIINLTADPFVNKGVFTPPGPSPPVCSSSGNSGFILTSLGGLLSLLRSGQGRVTRFAPVIAITNTHQNDHNIAPQARLDHANMYNKSTKLSPFIEILRD